MEILVRMRTWLVFLVPVFPAYSAREHGDNWRAAFLPPNADVHSPFYLHDLARYEAFVYDALLDIFTDLPDLFDPHVLQDIEDYMHDYSEDWKISQAKVSKFGHSRPLTHNPILSLNMVWRIVRQLRPIVQAIWESYDIFLQEAEPESIVIWNGNSNGRRLVEDSENIESWPTEAALEEAMLALLRLQMVYGLNAFDLSVGRVVGVETGAFLKLPVMYDLAILARTKEFFSLALPWFEVLLDELYLLETKPEHVMEPAHMPYLNFSYVSELHMATAQEHDRKKESHDTQSLYMYRDKLLNENLSFVEPRFPVRNDDWTHVRRSANPINSYDLCSGANHQSEREKAKLFCWLDRTSSARLTIGPVKKELLSRNPTIVYLHQILSQATLDQLRTQMNPDEFMRARVPVPVQNSSASLEYQRRPDWDVRSSLILRHQELKPMKLSQMLEASTGLSVIEEGSSEPLLVTLYAVGGHVNTHMDTVLGADPSNRIATMMFYLEETEAGGFTAFPQAGIASRPSKGSAIFWYNLDLSGEHDTRTFHYGCPIIFGLKLVGTKWIRSGNQWRRKPCGTQQNQYASL